MIAIELLLLLITGAWAAERSGRPWLAGGLLGAATAIRAIEVKWPASGTVQEFKNAPMDAFLKIREGAATLERLERKAFKISTQPGTDAASMAHMLHTH